MAKQKSMGFNRDTLEANRERKARCKPKNMRSGKPLQHRAHLAVQVDAIPSAEGSK